MEAAIQYTVASQTSYMLIFDQGHLGSNPSLIREIYYLLFVIIHFLFYILHIEAEEVWS